jgi:acetyltransferase-like isoleucine patch superfamily enzyme
VIISTDGRVEIGSHCMIGWSVVIADVAHPTPPASRSALGDPPSAEIVIGDNVWIGARAVVLGGARVGEGAIVGAAAVVDFEVPPYTVAAGAPARIRGPVPSAEA